MKKKRLRVLGLAALLLVSALVMAGCGADPNDLAKQTYDLYQESIEAVDNPLKLPGVMLKAASLGRKVNNLSERDRQIFDEELVRLGGVGLDGLFDIEELSSLFSGGDNGDAGRDGLFDIENLNGLFGGGSAQSGATAPSGGSSSSGDTTAPSSGDSGGSAALSGILGGRTGAFFSMFDGKNYHMKTKTILKGMEVIGETFIKGDMMASVSETMGISTRSVKRDNMMYVIYDEMRTVMVMPIPASAGNPSEEPVRTNGLIMTGSGTARFDGRNLPYEEYSLSTESVNARSQFFLDGNNLAGIRVISSGQTIDMVVLALDQNVPNSVFEIPAGYQRIEMPQEIR